MSVMFVLLPVALMFAAGALAVFLWAVRTGQFDDLETPPVRILLEDDPDPTRKPGGQAAPDRTRLDLVDRRTG